MPSESPGSARLHRIAALAAVAGASALVAVLLFGGKGGYSLSATFQNAGQLVEGNLVQVAGVKAGTVEDIAITDDGRARIEFSVDARYAPLPNGTRAVIRQASLSGIANRYVELRLPDSSTQARPGSIGDGGEIPADDTDATVDLDQLFNTLDPRTRRGLQRVIKGSAEQYAGRGDDARRAFGYLNPALAQSSRLFNELNRDTPTLERFLLDTARLVNALADRSDHLTQLVTNLRRTTRALGSRKQDLADAIGRLAPFMRRANTTFVNLRGALDDLDPLVAASKPAARRLRPFLAELQPFANDARPTVRDLDRILRRAGGGNDLVELINTFTPLADISVDRGERSANFGAGRRTLGPTDGAFPETATALADSARVIAFGRPYTPDLFGWFDDFSNTGQWDAIGGTSRATIVFNATSPQIPDLVIPDQLKDDIYRSTLKLGQYRRCPGGGDAPAADGSNVLSATEQEALDCTEEHRAVGER